MNERPQKDTCCGVLYALAAYGFWGFVPLYFAAVRSVGVWEILAHRVVWGLALLAGVVWLRGRWRELVLLFRSPGTVLLLLATASILITNWCVFIYGVTSDRVIDTSLGYFINPLFSVVLGLVFLKERLRPGQWLAVGLAGGGLIYLIVATGVLPWIGLTLAGLFGTYGLLRKYVRADALLALTAEMLFLLPLALAGLTYWGLTGREAFGGDPSLSALLLAAGVVTVFPLFCFGQAVRKVRLSTLGFLQYVGPTLQFLLAVLYFGEAFRPEQQVGFGLIWVALAVFSFDSLMVRRTAELPVPAAPSAEEEPLVEAVLPAAAREAGQAVRC